MKSGGTHELRDGCWIRCGVVDPQSFPGEEFELFSIPGFDAGSPEYRVGSSIGSHKTLVAPGDVLFSKLNPQISRVWIVPQARGLRQISSTEFLPLVLRDENRLDRHYLAYFLRSLAATTRLTGASNAATKSRSRLDSGHLLSVRVPLPSLADQGRIVASLDQLESIRRNRAEADHLAARILPAVFIRMFGDPSSNPLGWDVVPIGSLLAEQPRYGTMIPPAGGTWLDIRVANIQRGELDLASRRYVELPTAEEERFSVKDGDLLMARAIGSLDHLGKCVVARPQGQRWAFDSHLMRVRLDPSKAMPDYLQALLASPSGRQLFLARSRKSAVQFNINTGEFCSIAIPVPPLPLQVEFVRRTTALAEILMPMRSQRAALDRLFDVLLRQAFDSPPS